MLANDLNMQRSTKQVGNPVTIHAPHCGVTAASPTDIVDIEATTNKRLFRANTDPSPWYSVI